MGDRDALLREREETIRRQHIYIETLEKALAQRSADYDAISNATLWRMTWPLRRASAWLRHAPMEKRRPAKHGETPPPSLFSPEELKAQRSESFPRRIKISIATPLYNTPAQFLREMIQSVREQTYADWELCLADGSDGEHGEAESICRAFAAEDPRIRYRRLTENGGISANTNACLEMITGDYIGFLDHDDLLHPAALHQVMRAICDQDADFVYTDETIFWISPQNAGIPHLKPDYAPDTLCVNNYICHFAVFSRALLEAAGPLDPACDGAQDHDLFLRMTEKARRIAHIPEALYYWRAHPDSMAGDRDSKPYAARGGIRAVEKRLKRLGLEGGVDVAAPGETLYRVRYALRGQPRVSVLIDGAGDRTCLEGCLRSVFASSSYPDIEVVVACPGGMAPCDGLREVWPGLRTVTCPKGASVTERLNRAADACTGEYLLLLGGDHWVVSPDWIQELLMFAQRADVGAAGGLVLSKAGNVLQSGICLGLQGAAASFALGLDRQRANYGGRLLYARNVSAVSGDCLMLRRELWQRLKGVDTGYKTAYYDIDLCLRLRKMGLLIVWTPYAELCRQPFSADRKSRGRRADEKRFRRIWKETIGAGDPYFNPNFMLNRTDFAIRPVPGQHDARVL